MDLSRRTFVITTAATVAACACLEEEVALAQESGASGRIEVGAPTDFQPGTVVDTWAKSHKVLVVRNGNKIYATTAKCTHKSCTLKVKDGAIACPCHASKFTHEGTPTGGPAKTSLVRYKIGVENGKLVVDTGTSFDERNWDNAQAYVTV